MQEGVRQLALEDLGVGGRREVLVVLPTFRYVFTMRSMSCLRLTSRRGCPRHRGSTCEITHGSPRATSCPPALTGMENPLPGCGGRPKTQLMLGFVRTDSEALVSCLGDPQRTVAAYRELLRRGETAMSAIRAGLRDENPAVREGCCRLLDHLVDTESMDELVLMADDLDARVRIAAFHALACDRCKGDTCAPGPDRVLEPALHHLASDSDPHVRAMAAELVGKFAPLTHGLLPPCGPRTPTTQALRYARRQDGSRQAARSTNGFFRPRPGNGTTFNSCCLSGLEGGVFAGQE